MKKVQVYFLCVVFLLSTIITGIVYSKPAISCLVSCNQLFIGFDPDTNQVEGMGILNCVSGNQFCEFYTLLSVWYQNENGQLQYLNSYCNGGAMSCGTRNYPILAPYITLQSGYNYVIVFSVYDVNKGCGTCSNPVVCNAECRIYKNIDLR